MVLRKDLIAIELPRPTNPNANAAAAVQELLGGKFGEMSTLMNYTMQSFNFRGREKLRPFYDTIAAIAAEEYSHIELVSYAINLLHTGTTKRGTDPGPAPLATGLDDRNSHHYIASAQTALCMDSMGHYWSGDNVFSSGNLKLDLLHNFFLECGARANKMRVYEMTSDPTAREMIGFLLVRGGFHVVAYARALEKLTGVEVTKLVPIPDLSNKPFRETEKWTKMGLHRTLFSYSMDDFTQGAWVMEGGVHPEDGQPLEFKMGPATEGVKPPDLDAEPQLNAPGMDGIDIDMFNYVAGKMGETGKGKKK